MSQYMRVIIEGWLHCLSDVHPGSGLVGERAKEGKEANYNEIVLDARRRPYVPASSLRGYLSQHLVDRSQHLALFGDTGQMGKLRVYDARLGEEDAWVETRRARTAIDAVTRTAKENHLFNDILVPRNTRFALRLELDEIKTGVAKEELNALLDTLSSLNDGNPLARLGKGKSHGRGQLRWEKGRVSTLGDEAFAAWLESDDDLEQAGWQEYDYEGQYETSVGSWKIDYVFHSPVLVNDPAIVEPKSKSHPEDDKPDMRFMRTADGSLLVPGSSLKGMFRAHARRILLTMGGSAAPAEALLGELFGSSEGMGVLIWYDALATFKEQDIHQQTIIAIDRFTGGVQQGAMLNLEAVKVERATSALAFRKHLSGWQRALWLLLMRDAMEGDLAIGWGQARGFGAFELEITRNGKRCSSLGDWLEDQDQARLEADFKALEDALNGGEA